MSIRVLIIDDSAFVRKLLTDILDSDPRVEVVGTAADPIFALNKIKKLDPDVITCDVEMPRMDGLTFLKKLMDENPKPVVMISSHLAENCQISLRALELGAVEVIQKPGGDFMNRMQEISDEIVTAVKTAARARVRIGVVKPTEPRPERDLYTPKPKAPPVQPKGVISGLSVGKKHLIDELIPAAGYKSKGFPPKKIIAIGASTGGTVAVGEILKKLPLTIQGIVIVQHISADFTKPFAERLNSLCRIEVREARDGDRVNQGTALVAPGYAHLLLKRDREGYFVKLLETFPVNRHKPSVDVLFRTAASEAGPHAIGVILTGMNDDGARAMKSMHDNGAYNIAQDEDSCVVFGMPKNAIATGGVDIVAPLDRIAEIIIRNSRLSLGLSGTTAPAF